MRAFTEVVDGRSEPGPFGNRGRGPPVRAVPYAAPQCALLMWSDSKVGSVALCVKTWSARLPNANRGHPDRTGDEVRLNAHPRSGCFPVQPHLGTASPSRKVRQSRKVTVPRRHRK